MPALLIQGNSGRWDGATDLSSVETPAPHRAGGLVQKLPLTETSQSSGLTDSRTVENVSTFQADQRLVAVSTYPEVLKDVSELADILTFCGNPKPYSIDSSTFIDRIPQLRDSGGSVWFQEDHLTPENCADPFFCTGGADEDAVTLVSRAMQVRRPVQEPLALIQSVRSSYINEGNILSNRAPASSLGAYTGLLSIGDWDPTYRSPAWSILARFLYTSYTPTGMDAAVRVRKLSTVDRALRSGEPADIGDAVLLNLRRLPQAHLGLVRKFGTNIIDVSNTHEGRFEPLRSRCADPLLLETISLSLSKQDLEIGLFMSVIPFNVRDDASVSYRIEVPDYNVVDHAISLFGERDQILLSKERTGRLMRYARVLRTLFYQTASMRYGVSPFMDRSRTDHRGQHIRDYIEMNITATTSDDEFDSHFLWVPFEIVPVLGGRDITDPEDYVLGRNGNRVAKGVKFPRSFRRPLEEDDRIVWEDGLGVARLTLGGGDDRDERTVVMVSWPKSVWVQGSERAATVDRTAVWEELGGGSLTPFRTSAAPTFVPL